MKISPAQTGGYTTVTAYSDAAIEIDGVSYTSSLIVLPESTPAPWPVNTIEELNACHFSQFPDTRPDVVIIGTGRRQRFVDPSILTRLFSLRIGVECMSNMAACRTYNILSAEGRRIVLALVLEAA